MKINEALDRFRDLISIQFMAETTKKSYLFHVEKFLQYYTNLEDTDNIQLKQFQDYILWMKDEKYSTGYICVAVSAIRTFAEAVLDRKYTKRQIPKPKTERQEAAYYESKQVRLMLDQCPDIRLKAWIILAFDCGMRVSEIARLQWSDVDNVRHTITIRQSKRDKTRIVPYSPFTKAILNAYWRVYESARYSAYVFPGRKKEDLAISPSTISSSFKRYSGTFPFTTERHSFHSLRHSYATSMIDKVNPYELALLMGHSSIQTTMNYVHLSRSKFKDVTSPCNSWE